MYARKYLALFLTLALLLPCMTALGAEDDNAAMLSALTDAGPLFAVGMGLNENVSPATLAKSIQSELDTAQAQGITVSRDAATLLTACAEGYAALGGDEPFAGNAGESAAAMIANLTKILAALQTVDGKIADGVTNVAGNRVGAFPGTIPFYGDDDDVFVNAEYRAVHRASSAFLGDAAATTAHRAPAGVSDAEGAATPNAKYSFGLTALIGSTNGNWMFYIPVKAKAGTYSVDGQSLDGIALVGFDADAAGKAKLYNTADFKKADGVEYSLLKPKFGFDTAPEIGFLATDSLLLNLNAGVNITKYEVSEGGAYRVTLPSNEQATAIFAAAVTSALHDANISRAIGDGRMEGAGPRVTTFTQVVIPH
ncbi:MAG: hypothetical protein Q4E65_08645 [Clostridia bacterium]|nr:hypothetical protein [Clostridia bacterium]